MIDEQSADRTRSEFARVAHGATVAPSQRQLDDGWRTMRSKLHDRGWFAASRSAAPVRRLLWAVPAAAALCGGVWGRLQQGEASFDVKHRDDTRWTIDAGPFVVHVTGTAFKVRWDEARGHFQIEMRSGSVDVDGPTLSGQRPLRTGESIDVVLRPEAASLANEREQQPSEPPALDEPKRAAAPEGGPPAASTPAPAPDKGWTELLARGKVKEIIAQAEAGGISQALSTRGAADLVALADAARYTRQNDLARKALSTVRSRFPSSRQSRDAAFFLGRLEESSAPARALEWYERYLMEAPTGTYAAEAMGRKMLVVERVQGRQAALPLARDYLARFPEGSYAGLARSLLGSR